MSDALEKAFPIYEDADGEFRFRIVGGNGEIVASGESYKTRAGAERGRKALTRILLKALGKVESTHGPSVETPTSDELRPPGDHQPIP